jgi:hypothetical protein
LTRTTIDEDATTGVALGAGSWQTWDERRPQASRRAGSFVILGAIVGLVGCGPRIDEPQDWMLGVFSDAQPRNMEGWMLPGRGDSGSITSTRISRDVYWTDTNNGINTSGVQGPNQRTWEPRGEDAIAFSDPTDSRANSSCGEPARAARTRSRSIGPRWAIHRR